MKRTNERTNKKKNWRNHTYTRKPNQTAHEEKRTQNAHGYSRRTISRNFQHRIRTFSVVPNSICSFIIHIHQYCRECNVVGMGWKLFDVFCQCAPCNTGKTVWQWRKGDLGWGYSVVSLVEAIGCVCCCCWGGLYCCMMCLRVIFFCVLTEWMKSTILMLGDAVWLI